MQQQHQCMSVSLAAVSLGSRRGGYSVLVCRWDKQPLGTMAVQVRSLPIDGYPYSVFVCTVSLVWLQKGQPCVALKAAVGCISACIGLGCGSCHNCRCRGRWFSLTA